MESFGPISPDSYCFLTMGPIHPYMARSAFAAIGEDMWSFADASLSLYYIKKRRVNILDNIIHSVLEESVS